MRKFICLLLWGLIMASCGERSNEKKLRILTCGIRHESNTFSTLVTDLSSFDVLRGEELYEIPSQDSILSQIHRTNCHEDAQEIGRASCRERVFITV